MTAEPLPEATEEPTPPERFLDRELSWLAFNLRVLELAEDTDIPLLERAKFLAIFSELLDEFYQIRVAALEDQVAAGVRTRSVDGLRPGEQLTMIRVPKRLVQAGDAILRNREQTNRHPDLPQGQFVQPHHLASPANLVYLREHSNRNAGGDEIGCEH